MTKKIHIPLEIDAIERQIRDTEEVVEQLLSSNEPSYARNRSASLAIHDLINLELIWFYTKVCLLNNTLAMYPPGKFSTINLKQKTEYLRA